MHSNLPTISLHDQVYTVGFISYFCFVYNRDIRVVHIVLYAHKAWVWASVIWVMCFLDFCKQFFQSKLPYEITGKFRECAHIFVYVKFIMADGRDCSNSKKGSAASYWSQIWSVGHSC